MSDNLYPVADALTQGTHFGDAQYKEMYEASISDPDAFWDIINTC